MLNLVDRATKAVEWVVVALAALGSAIIVIQMVWISYGVFMRYVMGQPDRMVTEATALLLFPVALVGLAYAMREDSYPRVTLLTDAFSPPLQKLVALMNGAIMVLIGGVLFHHHGQRHDPGVQFRVVLGNPELAALPVLGCRGVRTDGVHTLRHAAAGADRAAPRPC